jgi:hypothetical protein
MIAGLGFGGSAGGSGGNSVGPAFELESAAGDAAGRGVGGVTASTVDRLLELAEADFDAFRETFLGFPAAGSAFVVPVVLTGTLALLFESDLCAVFSSSTGCPAGGAAAAAPVFGAFDGGFDTPSLVRPAETTPCTPDSAAATNEPTPSLTPDRNPRVTSVTIPTTVAAIAC